MFQLSRLLILGLLAFKGSSLRLPHSLNGNDIKDVVIDEPDYIVADGKLIDRNEWNPRRIKFPWGSEASTDRQTSPPWYTSHYQALTKGIDGIEYNNWLASVLSIYGEKTFPIATNAAGDVIIAGAEHGKGRVIIMGRYELATGDAKPSVIKLMTNACNWLANGQPPVIATHTTDKVAGISSTQNDVAPSALATASGINVYLLNAHSDFPDSDVDTLKKYVASGGGLIIAGQAWYWGYSGITNEVTYANGYPGNKVASAFGAVIGWLDGYSRISPVSPMPGADNNLLVALQSIAAGKKTDTGVKTITRTGELALNLITAGLTDFLPLISTAATTLRNLDADADKIVYSRLVDSLLAILINKSPPESVTASNVAKFPYNLLSDAPSVTKMVKIDGNTLAQPGQFGYSAAGEPIWRSTGLYAKAGTIVTVTIPDAGIGKLMVQIGCHRDTLYDKPTLDRNPNIVTKFPSKSSTVKASNPWGGLIYIKVLHNSNLGLMDINIADAYEAPYYIHGVTTNDDWNNKIKNYPAPWAELEIPGQIILSMRSTSLRTVTDIVALGNVYSDIMTWVNKLAGLEKRFRTERFAFDIQIGGGWMHSGYPMMGYISAETEHVNAKGLRKDGTWGIIHEIGHNHQWMSWTVTGTTETGCNWFALYVNQNLFKIKWNHDAMQPSKSLSRIYNWVFKGKPAADWDTWLPLDTYSILAEIFTWGSYTKTMVKYYSLPDISENTEKWNRWALLYSQSVNTNLCPYFEWWGWTLTADTKASCAQLPAWNQNPLSKFSAPQTTATCETGWTALGDACYWHEKTQKLNWADAEAKCQSLGFKSHLASCMEDNELAYLAYQNINVTNTFFVGISDTNYFTKFQNLNGNDIGAVSVFFPTTVTNKHCATLRSGQVETRKCLESNNYICKRGSTSCGMKASGCPSGWVQKRNSCYFFSKQEFTKWADGQNACKNLSSSASLVIINDLEEATFLSQYAYDLYAYKGYNYWGGYYNGLVSTGVPKEYQWFDGTKVSFQLPWCANEPSDNMKDALLITRSGCFATSNYDSQPYNLCKMAATS